MTAEADSDPVASVTRGFRLVLARAPQAAEVEQLISLYQRELEQYRSDGTAAEAMAGPRDEKAKELNKAQLAAWTVVANVLLNLDEAVTK
jgi:hypothetical protein